MRLVKGAAAANVTGMSVAEYQRSGSGCNGCVDSHTAEGATDGEA